MATCQPSFKVLAQIPILHPGSDQVSPPLAKVPSSVTQPSKIDNKKVHEFLSFEIVFWFLPLLVPLSNGILGGLKLGFFGGLYG